MADPLSIAGLAISVAQVCGSLITKLVNFTKELQHGDDDLVSFTAQVETLEAVVKTVRVELQPYGRPSDSGVAEWPVWKALHLALTNLDRNLRRFSDRVSDVNGVAGGKENGEVTMTPSQRVTRSIALQWNKSDLSEMRSTLQTDLLALNTAILMLHIHEPRHARDQRAEEITAWSEDVQIAQLLQNVDELEARSSNGTADVNGALDQGGDAGLAEFREIAAQIVEEASEKSRSRSNLADNRIGNPGSNPPTFAPAIPNDSHEVVRQTAVQRNELVSANWELITIIRSILALGVFCLLCYLASLNQDDQTQIFQYAHLDYGSFAIGALVAMAGVSALLLLITWGGSGSFRWHLCTNAFRTPACCLIWDGWFLCCFGIIGGIGLRFAISIPQEVAREYSVAATSLRCAGGISLLVSVLSVANLILLRPLALLKTARQALDPETSQAPAMSHV